MTTQALTASTYIDTPVVPPQRNNLLSVATVNDRESGVWEFGTQYDSFVAGLADSADDGPCWETGGTKNVSGRSTIVGTPFTVYELVKCGIIGEATEQIALARSIVEMSQSRAAELRLATRWNAGSPTVLTSPGVNTNIANAVAALEGWIAAQGGGLGMIHATPLNATRMAAAGLLEYIDGVLCTYIGTPVVVGPGYTTPASAAIGGTTPTSTQSWLYATGWITIERGPILENIAHNTVENEKYALAERTMVPQQEYGTAAILTVMT
jgi:hypothetical protein